MLDEAVAEVGAESEGVIAEEGGEVELGFLVELPSVREGDEKIVGAIELTIVDGVVGDGELDGDQAGDEGETVVGEAVESEFVAREFELAITVELVLLAVFEAIEETVAEGGFGGEPGVGGGILRAPASGEIDIAVVTSELDEIAEALARNVSGGEIDGVVALADVEGATIDGDGIDDGGNQEIGIGVTVAVGVGGEIVGEEEIADLEELRDGFAVITGNAWSEILRGFDAAGSGFDGETGDGDGSARAPGIGVEDLVVDDDGLGGIGGERRGRRSNDGDGLEDGGELLELEDEGFLLGGGEREGKSDGSEGWGIGGETVAGGRDGVEMEEALGVGGGFGDGGVGDVEKLEMGVGDGGTAGIEDGAGEYGRKLMSGGHEAKEV